MAVRWQRVGVVVLSLVAWAVVLAGLFFAVSVFSTQKAHAQGGGFVSSGRNDSNPHGRYLGMWNSTGVTITDGTLVMIDTLQATTNAQIPMGKAFKTWDGTEANAYRLVGVTLGDVPGNSWGRIMVEGFHRNVLMAATGVAGFAKIRPSFTVAGAAAGWAAADSISSAREPIGIFQRYKDGSTLRGYCWIKMPNIAHR